MAPRLAKVQRVELENIIVSKLEGSETVKDNEIAHNITSCSSRTVRAARSNILRHGTIDPPPYTIDGVIYCEVYEENTDTEVFEGFLERLLPYCSRYPAPRSVIFMDNASFHFVSQTLKDLIAQAGVIIEFQVPYSPDTNPIEYLFRSVKNRIRKMSLEDEDLIQGDFKSYLLMQIRDVGRDRRIARGHFKKAQIDVNRA
ncbi:TPR domain-containing protein [Colletotrichum kahawae]|uniref:TPR domain-containing protein n=1 Tax=Colletotrichum kahawae TaxID=34407 RepID=A0AAE0D5E5_COLKA|nr:TPR domain-containing protein [Colletotrichum kahawae]